MRILWLEAQNFNYLVCF